MDSFREPGFPRDQVSTKPGQDHRSFGGLLIRSLLSVVFGVTVDASNPSDSEAREKLTSFAAIWDARVVRVRGPKIADTGGFASLAARLREVEDR